MPVAQGLSASERETLQQTFKDIDEDHNGVIDEDELAKLLNKFNGGRRVPRDRVHSIFVAADTDHNGSIDFNEFVVSFEKVRKTGTERARQIFSQFDTDGNGMIDRKEMREAAAKLGIRMTDADVQVLLDEFDVNKDENIQFDEFLGMMRALGL